MNMCNLSHSISEYTESKCNTSYVIMYVAFRYEVVFLQDIMLIHSMYEHNQDLAVDIPMRAEVLVFVVRFDVKY